VIEEAALGDADGRDQFLNRGCRETLLKYGGFGNVENSLTRVAALTRCLLHLSFSPALAWEQLYHECT
jgi:hypothetical protein